MRRRHCFLLALPGHPVLDRDFHMIVAGVGGQGEEGSVAGVLSRHAEELGDVAVEM